MPDQTSLGEMQVAWYAVQVKRHNESRAVRHLALRDIPAFLPLIEGFSCYRSRRVARLEPLFPGYLFVRLEPTAENPRPWYTVRWSPGVRCILTVDDTPVPVPNAVIDAIQDRVRDFGFIRLRNPFRRGMTVRIMRGPFEGLGAVFDRSMSRAGRVRVLLELLGQQRSVEVDALDLESA